MEQEGPTLFVADVPCDSLFSAALEHRDRFDAVGAVHRHRSMLGCSVVYALLEQEFIELFQACDGFVAARLRSDKNDNRVGFVDFDTPQRAAQARERLQGHKFSDLEPGLSAFPLASWPHTLDIHFSKRADQRGKRNRESFDDHPKPLPGPRIPPAAAAHSPYAPPHIGLNPYHAALPPTLPPGVPPAYSHLQYPPLPVDASATLYVEGLPSDATEREVSHIFRPFSGYSSLRILQKESKGVPVRVYNLCFVEFDNKYQATVAMHALQGYRMDKTDTKGLTISYAKSDRKERRRNDKPQTP